MRTLLIATRNPHKVQEIQAILGETKFAYRTLRDFPGAPGVVEDAATFAGNAAKKARELARWVAAEAGRRASLGKEALVLADDSGLEVDALKGAPGVRSARFAASESGASGNTPDQANNEKLLKVLANVPREQRSARFRCLIALAPLPGPAADVTALTTELFDGTCEGWIDFAPRGKGGFGYDPLFVPQGFEQSFAELGEEIKNQLSHRAKALEKVRRRLQGGR